MTTNRSSKVAGWTGGGKRGAAARKLFNAQREARADAAAKADPVATGAALVAQHGFRYAEKAARGFAELHPVGSGRQTFWLAVAESIADAGSF